MDHRPILVILGTLTAALALFMFIPAIADLVSDHEDWRVFATSGFAAFFLGVVTVAANRGCSMDISVRQAFVLTVLSWIFLAAFAALPFRFSHLGMSYTDAYFEAMSGLTTTGATVIVGLDKAPPGILLWRAILQGIGGVGIIVMAVAVLPFLRVGGMQLFRLESSDKSEKLMPKAAHMAMAIILVYLGLITLCGFALWLAGMTPFDAATHALATISTGGFSTHDDSVRFFASPAIEWIIIVFMVGAGLPLTYYVRMLQTGLRASGRESQVRAFLMVMGGFAGVMTLWLWIGRDFEFAHALRLSAFNIASVMTTTGFVTADYSLWGDFALMTFLILAFVGGCTGSTSGAIKIFRWQILFRYGRAQLSLMFQPSRVISLKYDQTAYSSDLALSVIVFIAAYVISTAALAMAVSLTGVDFLSSLSGVVASIGNVGPGLGNIVGPCCTFQPLPPQAKWLMALAMLFGRLEIFTIIVLFTRNFWRR
jgi:trk system potassium uptake protein TrkH